MNTRIRVKIAKNFIKMLYGKNSENLKDKGYVYALAAKRNMSWLLKVKKNQHVESDALEIINSSCVG